MVRSTNYPVYKKYVIAVVLLSAALPVVCQDSGLYDCEELALRFLALCFLKNDCYSDYDKRRKLDHDSYYYDIPCSDFNTETCNSIDLCPACSDEIMVVETCYRDSDEFLVGCPLVTEESCACIADIAAENVCFFENGCSDENGHWVLGEEGLEQGESYYDETLTLCARADEDFCSFLGFCPACSNEIKATEPCYREDLEDCIIPSEEECDEGDTMEKKSGKKEGKKEGKAKKDKDDSYFAT
mmetsp:Transcript_1774/g.2604  ORF Transcript_1774/g.2604 Transcript_1774/m.2604 type:complete len:242 (+) Transcript_1774:46-771(+)